MPWIDERQDEPQEPLNMKIMPHWDPHRDKRTKCESVGTDAHGHNFECINSNVEGQAPHSQHFGMGSRGGGMSFHSWSDAPPAEAQGAAPGAAPAEAPAVAPAAEKPPARVPTTLPKPPPVPAAAPEPIKPTAGVKFITHMTKF